MKPLELTVYPHVMDAGFDCIEDHEGTLRIDRELDDFAQAKRFTDAELAAETHAANSDAWRAHSAKSTVIPVLEDRFVTFHRFATLPHYDQEEDQA